MTVTCVLTYIIALIPLICYSMPQDDMKHFNTFYHEDLDKPSSIDDILIVNEKRNSRDFWANYLARFKDSEIREHDKRGQDSMLGYFMGFSFRERQMLCALI